MNKKIKVVLIISFIILFINLISGCGPKVLDPPLDFYIKPEFKDCSQVKERNCELNNLLLSYDFDYNRGDMDVTKGSYYLIDTNRDDLYDLLLIEIEVKSNVEDNYTFYMHLDNEKEPLIISERKQKIKKGKNIVKFDFKTGLLKSRNYTVTMIVGLKRERIFYDEGLFSLNINSDIKLECPPFTVDIVSHEYVNADDDPEYELLQINAVFDIKKSGIYCVNVSIGDAKGTGSLIGSLKNISLEEGKHETALLFDTKRILKEHWKKIKLYKIEIIYENISYENIFNYTIEDFNVEKLEKGTQITGPFSEETIDIDNDGLIDELVINTGVYCAEEGTYILESELYDAYENRVQIIKKEIPLKEGQQTVKVEFNGSKIYSEKINGPYVVKYIKLTEPDVDSPFESIDSILEPIITEYYEYGQFEIGDVPDLAIVELKKGDNEVVAKIKNIGKIHAFVPMVSFFDQDFNLIEENLIDYIAPNDIKEIKIDLGSKKPTKVYVIIDYDNKIEETNKTNNLAEIEI